MIIAIITLVSIGIITSMQFLPNPPPGEFRNDDYIQRLHDDTQRKSYRSLSSSEDSNYSREYDYWKKKFSDEEKTVSDLEKIVRKKLQSLTDKELRKESREGYFQNQAYGVRRERVMKKYHEHQERKRLIEQVQTSLDGINPYKLSEKDIKILKEMKRLR